MSHGYHPRHNELDDTRGPSPIFFDGCEDCEEKANDPLRWSQEVAAAVWKKMNEVEYKHTGRYRSDAEAKAGLRAYHISVFVERNMLMGPSMQLSAIEVWLRKTG
jgi:hypothetical protein